MMFRYFPRQPQIENASDVLDQLWGKVFSRECSENYVGILVPRP